MEENKTIYVSTPINPMIIVSRLFYTEYRREHSDSSLLFNISGYYLLFLYLFHRKAPNSSVAAAAATPASKTLTSCITPFTASSTFPTTAPTWRSSLTSQGMAPPTYSSAMFLKATGRLVSSLFMNYFFQNFIQRVSQTVYTIS